MNRGSPVDADEDTIIFDASMRPRFMNRGSARQADTANSGLGGLQ